jgi:hypothetical protein
MGNALLTRMRRILPLLLCLSGFSTLSAATLERLSLDDLAQKSTDIVRARVVGSPYADLRGSSIYTHWKIQVTDRWKGSGGSAIEVLVPGGDANGLHQDVPGAPRLVQGKEYLLFLWTSKSGATYITGWGQGVFSLTQNTANDWIASRGALGETMLDHATWLPVQDQGVQMRYADMATQVSATLARGAAR